MLYPLVKRRLLWGNGGRGGVWKAIHPLGVLKHWDSLFLNGAPGETNRTHVVFGTSGKDIPVF